MKFSDCEYPFDIFMIESDVPLFYTPSTEKGIDFPVYNIGFFSKNSTNRDDHILIGFTYAKTNFELFGSVRYIENPNSTFEESIKHYSEDMKQSIKDEVNIFFNTILYINDPNRVVLETEIKGQRNQGNGHNGKYVQNFIKLTTPKSYRSIETNDSIRTLEVRFIVRGHWRNQSHGEKHSLHKYIWIKPYYKGPEFGQEVSKHYLVK
jgi:hypothetical protein